ncbi:hypothetical protein A3A60_03685 [Candidatus Curtissbacteria bacterium RIFCSPLOWO2_01_FULL_42_26]|uniref:DUF5678 domain-containing protein n=1 Tax=Candidatus Curtissbacteria bacterium RIFCSPLOWO2_01_FULL_42_26 TaxID=1797729 RepID=A0A1F5HW25_9BACT|nr:MAG: hypothetical protein A3A60_03685 [Candidatus Curtissbacteria bacterium RIFCSPLOWO2_01_FULL_42_26]
MARVDLRKILDTNKSGWLALTRDNKKKIASGKTLHEVLKKAKQKGVETPSVLKVPNLKTAYIG